MMNKIKALLAKKDGMSLAATVVSMMLILLMTLLVMALTVQTVNYALYSTKQFDQKVVLDQIGEDFLRYNVNFATVYYNNEDHVDMRGDQYTEQSASGIASETWALYIAKRDVQSTAYVDEMTVSVRNKNNNAELLSVTIAYSVSDAGYVISGWTYGD